MKILLHIPHTSLRLPHKFYKGLLISKEKLKYYNYEMTDLAVDKLFKSVKGIKVKAKYSRLFCDVEKFKDSSLEPMAKYGQGVIYTNTFDQTLFHKHSNSYEKKVYKYYDKYHQNLDKIALKLLKKDPVLLILDCHSFSDQMATQHHSGPFPDVCIGIEKDFYNEEIINTIINEIKKRHLTYEINFPYQGSMIPNVLFKGNYKGKVFSIMLEINKRVYF